MSARRRAGCLLLVAYPLVEACLAVAIARAIGWWWLLVIVVACVVLGLGLVRYALSATGRSLGTAITTLQASGQPLAIGANDHLAPPAQTLLIVPAGLLIAIPGLLTTVVGLALWPPCVRARIAARWARAARRWEPPGAMGSPD